MTRWENNVRKVVPYVPGEQPDRVDMIKLNTNENPYGPSPMVERTLKDINADKLRLYPDPASQALIQALAAYHGLSPEQIFVGVGSDDVLALSFLTFFQSEKPILFPDITYSFYDVWADLYRIPYRCPQLDAELQICPQDYMAENGGIIFPNPNAPTGIYLGLDKIRTILDHNRAVVVIIDEAYIDFGGTSALSLLAEYDNLFIVRTFSKSRSLAGMRIGYGLGQPKLIRYLSDVKYSFNSYTMDQTALAIGAASVKDEAYFKETVHKVIHTREWVREELIKLSFQVTDSKGNFLFVTHPCAQAEELMQKLREQGIYVRHFARERIRNYLRITIGTEQEMRTVVDSLKKILKEKTDG